MTATVHHGITLTLVPAGYVASCLGGWQSEDRPTRRLASIDGQIDAALTAADIVAAEVLAR